MQRVMQITDTRSLNLWCHSAPSPGQSVCFSVHPAARASLTESQRKVTKPMLPRAVLAFKAFKMFEGVYLFMSGF